MKCFQGDRTVGDIDKYGFEILLRHVIFVFHVKNNTLTYVEQYLSCYHRFVTFRHRLAFATCNLLHQGTDLEPRDTFSFIVNNVGELNY